ADAVETVKQLRRVAKLEFVHLKSVKSDRPEDKHPMARFLMTMKPDASGHGEEYSFTDTTTNKPVPTEEILKQSEVIIDGSDLQPTSKQNIDAMTHQIIVEFELKGDG